MGDLMAQLKPEYDVIDRQPALTAGVDSFVLGTLTGSLLVARTGHRTARSPAALEVLDRLPIRLLGAVMNDVPKGAAYGYYAYYSYYLPGYESVEERDSREAASPLVV